MKRLKKSVKRNNNKKAVLDCIQNQTSINRSAISKHLGISITAVMNITDELIEHEIIRCAGFGTNGIGKRPELLEARDDKFRYIGVDVGRIHLRCVIVGQDGKEIGSLTRRTAHYASPELCIKDICTLIWDILSSTGVDRNTIVGICVAMPGLIEIGTGKVIFSPNFGWQNIELQKILNIKLSPFQVIVRNANRAQARYEIRPGSEYACSLSTVFCMGLGYGIGSATIINGNMYCGASGTSGEIGHITVKPDGPKCSCGNRGCIEAISSGAAIEKEGRVQAREHEDSKIFTIVNGDFDKIEAKTVFDAAASGDKYARNIIENAGKYIGIALASAINILDPDVIYLCGGLIKNGPDFLNQIKKYTRERQMKYAGRKVKILQGSIDDFNVAKGATLLIQDEGVIFEKLSFLY